MSDIYLFCRGVKVNQGAANIYLVGHGTWATKNSPNPYTQVPKGTSVVIYTPIGTFINSDQTSAILLDEPGCLVPNHVFTEFQSCPNTTLSHGVFPEETDALNRSGKTYHHPGVGISTLLSDILANKAFQGHTIHWLACQPRFSGKDTTQGGFNDDYPPRT